MEKEPFLKSVTMYENLETLSEARTRIRDLENELALSNSRVAHCEKEKCDLTAVIEKLHAKFIRKPLHNAIDQLESNLLLLNDAIGGIEHNANENSPSSNDGGEIPTVEDTKDRSQPESDLRTKVTDYTNIFENDAISLSSDEENVADDQDSIGNEPSVNTANLLIKIKESLKRMVDGVDKVCDKMSSDESNPTTTPDVRRNVEIFTINCDDDDSDCADNRPVSSPTIPLIIELNDSSCESDPDDCLLLDDIVNIANDSTIDQQKANCSSGVSEKIPLIDSDPPQSSTSVESESGKLPTHVNEDVSLRSDLSNEVKNLKISGEGTLLYEISQKSTFNELNASLIESVSSNHATCSKNSPENTSFCCVSQKSTFCTLDDLSTGIINSDDTTRLIPNSALAGLDDSSTGNSNLDNSKITLEKISFSSDFQKPTTAELLDLLIENGNSNNATYPKINQENTSFNNTLQEPTFCDDLSTRIAGHDDTACSKIDSEKNSIDNVLPELTLDEVDYVSNETPNSSGDTTCSKSHEEKTPFSEFSRKSIFADSDDSSIENTNRSTAISTSNHEKSSRNDVSQKPVFDGLDQLSIENLNSNSLCSKINHENPFSSKLSFDTALNHLKDLLTENLNSNHGICTKTIQKETSFIEFSSNSNIADLDDFSTANPNFISSTPIINHEKPVFSDVKRKPTFDELDDLSTRNPNSTPGCSKITRKKISSNEVSSKSTPAELNDVYSENSDSDAASYSKISEEKIVSSEALPKSTLDELNDISSEKTNLGITSYLKINQEKISSSEIVPKSTLAKLDDVSAENENLEIASFSKTRQEKTSFGEVLSETSLAGLDDVSYEHANHDVASNSKTSQEKPTFSDVSSKPTPADLDDLSTESINPDSTKYSKVDKEKISPKPSPADLDDLSTESINPDSATCLKSSQENSFVGVLQKLSPLKFDDSSIHLGAEVSLPKIGCAKVATAVEENMADAEVSPDVTIIEMNDSSLIELCEETTLTISDASNDSVPKFDLKPSPFKIQLGRDPYEFDDSSSQSTRNVKPPRNDDWSSRPTKKIKQPQNDDSNGPACSRYKKRTYDSFESKVIKEEPGTENASNARKRAKYDIYGSYVSPSSLFFSSNSTSSVEEVRRRNRMPSWPCPLCDECFPNSFSYSKHLNQVHVGDKGVFTCSICHFVCATLTGHKRHVSKYHSAAFLMENRYQYVHHLNIDHRYAKTNFNS